MENIRYKNGKIPYVEILPAGILKLFRYSRVRYIQQFPVGLYKKFAGT